MSSASASDDPARELRGLVDAGRFRDALEWHRHVADQVVLGLPEVQLLSATAATRVADFARATALAQAALDAFRAGPDADGQMRALNLLGANAWEQGRLDEAERRFGEALELANRLNDSLMAAHASNNLASIAYLRNRADMALSLFRIALLSYQRLGDRRGTAQTHHNLGIVFRNAGQWSDADSASLRAIHHAEQVGEGSLVALTVMGRAEIHLARGELDLAARELARSVGLARDAKDEAGLAETGRLAAAIALKEGSPTVALQRAEAARRKAERLGIPQIEAECAAVEALALKHLGRKEESNERRAEVIARFTKLGAESLAVRFREEWGD